MSKLINRAGWVISGLAGFFMFTSGINLTFIQSKDVVEGFAKFGYSPNVIPGIGIAALAASLLYLFPRTSALGAILLTGYLGGATATHVRVNDPTFIAPIVVGCFLWLGIFMRDTRVRQLVPLSR